MKIVFLNVSGGLGGAERLLVDMLHGLREACPAWRFEVLLGQEGPLLPLLMESGFEVSVLPFPSRVAALGDSGAAGWRGRFSLLLSLLMALPELVHYSKQLRSHLARAAPDAVHSNGFKMHVLAAMVMPPGARLIWHIHDFVSARPAMRLLLRRYSHAASAYVAISRSVAQDLRSVVSDPERIRTVWNAVDLNRFSPSGPVCDLDSIAGIAPEPGAVRIGLIATFAKWKGHDVFLRALAALPAGLLVRAYIIGAPVYRTAGSQYSLQQIATRAASLLPPGSVYFTGFLPDTSAAMRDLDIVVHASTEPEPFGLVIAEAMACGRAVVASMGGGAAEILSPGVNGLGHVPGDAAQLAQCIERFARHPELRRAYGAAARKTAEALFPRERLAQELIPLYTAR